ncbi:uncharacterized protein LOC106174345 [Lingula anatina]|uniref:Uncharacterized protein LOC106174345 n=1 Tax=Lingula anatina TaxID=7574 RepID=A0A1S3JLP2_LINAN|nr:uncharacterized protein LOC106174345 [Lingula anatina]|eukprot:XP_013411330.1 uncharacterized protein LOC106174345 [Lingula anatina]
MAGFKGTVYCVCMTLVLLKTSIPASAICNETFYDAGNITIPSNETSCTFFLECSTNNETVRGMVLMFRTVPADITKLQIRDGRGYVLGDYKDDSSIPIGVSTMELMDKPALRIDLTRSLKERRNSSFANFTTKTSEEMEGTTILTAAEGSIFSPAWPANYPANMALNYAIHTKYDNGKITVKFKAFNLGNGSLLFMASTEQDEVVYSSASPPSDFHAKANRVAMLFVSKNSTGQGFHIVYNEVCPYNNEEVSCEEAQKRGQRWTVVVVLGSIGTVLALIALVAFFYWYIKKNYHKIGYQDFSDPRHGMIN